MKLKIKEIMPNQFKKSINNGKLDEETIKRIQSNIKELGLMGALPVYKKDKNYHLVAGHHRLEALKREFGKEYLISVEVHNYNEDQVLRGMVIENLTQRYNEFREEIDNLVLIQEYLRKKAICSTGEQMVKRPQGGGHQPENGSVRDIHAWLNLQGEVMSIGKISNYLNIDQNLDDELKEKVRKAPHSTADKDGEILGIKDAIALSKFKDKDEQKDLANALLKSREQHGNDKTKNITAYKNADEEIKSKVRIGKIDLADVELYSSGKEIKDKIKEIKGSDENEIKIIKSREIIDSIRTEIHQTNRELDRLMFRIRGIKKANFYFYKPKEKQDFFKLVTSTRQKVINWANELEKIQNQIELEVVDK